MNTLITGLTCFPSAVSGLRPFTPCVCSSSVHEAIHRVIRMPLQPLVTEDISFMKHDDDQNLAPSVPPVSASCQQQTALPPVSSPPFTLHACDFAPVCCRLADRHAGPAAGGRGPHPPLLPPGALLALLQLQESLLQAHRYHTLHCRYVEHKR